MRNMKIFIVLLSCFFSISCKSEKTVSFNIDLYSESNMLFAKVSIKNNTNYDVNFIYNDIFINGELINDTFYIKDLSDEGMRVDFKGKAINHLTQDVFAIPKDGIYEFKVPLESFYEVNICYDYEVQYSVYNRNIADIIGVKDGMFISNAAKWYGNQYCQSRS